MKRVILIVIAICVSFIASAQMKNEIQLNTVNTLCQQTVHIVWYDTITLTVTADTMNANPQTVRNKTATGANQVLLEFYVEDNTSGSVTSAVVLNPSSTSGSVTYSAATNCGITPTSPRVYWNQNNTYSFVGISIRD